MEATQEKKYKILVVDDNSENIRIIGSVLRQNKYNIGFATGGQAALNVLNGNAHDYDLVLLDVNMPDMNGFEVCKKIRANEDLKEIPIIFLTANTLPEQIVEGFSSGGQDYVTKPFHSGELLARIKTHLELKDSRKKLQQINIVLEEKVKERTKDLLDVNLKLEVANQELMQLDEAKAGFLRLISHEINTPLNGIIGFADILKDQLISTEYFDLVEVLSESAHRLNEFAQSSLVITRMRTTPEDYQKSAVDVKEILNVIVDDFQSECNKKKIHIQWNWYAEKAIITGNRTLLQIGLMHILRNAIQYTKHLIIIESQQDHNHLILTFEDDGNGFSTNALQHLFEPFSTSSDHVDKNKGMGLSIVKMVLDFHQGEIQVSNKADGGAKIKIIFTAEF